LILLDVIDPLLNLKRQVNFILLCCKSI